MFSSKYRTPLIFRTFSSASSNDILFEVKNNIGIITLNRPRVLNSLTASMASAMYSKLKEWENERSFIIVKGSGDKAFCAGGDIISITKNKFEGLSLFSKQYSSNYLISKYKIPFVSLCDGITMGVGAGFSIQGTYRIATERTIFAMPETRIGLLTESGSSYFLPRMEGKLGLFLGLTGHKLEGIDVLKVGVATHFLPSDKIADLFDRLVETEADSIEDVLKKTTIDVGNKEFSLNSKMDLINSCFEGESVEDIIELLQTEGSPWSRRVLDILSRASPTSLKISKKVIDFGASRDLRDCLVTEFRLVWNAVQCSITSDFYEGVRAVLIDKDNNPKWSPRCLEEVDDAKVSKCFSPLPPGEELDI
ncbi:3-hydroxyisobutyryl-CoA hydrolase, mitochondrial-like [Planococcus citri]|uniref:3-hydroxyisobutyryl-CoA hydrolase, mitochondrial-like n=1 Tax=Planococcus citri TaxID=170843 RepID=UPI0031F8B13E